MHFKQTFEDELARVTADLEHKLKWQLPCYYEQKRYQYLIKIKETQEKAEADRCKLDLNYTYESEEEEEEQTKQKAKVKKEVVESDPESGGESVDKGTSNDDTENHPSDGVEADGGAIDDTPDSDGEN